MKNLFRLAPLLILLLLLLTPTLAQESTREPHAASTVDAAPIALATPDAAPVVVDSGGGSVTINTGSAPTAVTPAPNGLLSLTVGEVLAILLGTLAFMAAVGKALWDGNQPGTSLDTRLTQGVENAQQNRAYMDALARAYSEGNAALKQALDSSISVLQIIAPQTGLKIDDAALSLLKQIQQGQQPPTEALRVPDGTISMGSVTMSPGSTTTISSAPTTPASAG